MNWAKEILNLFGENGEHWCQGFNALNVHNRPCNPKDVDANFWCLIGACHKLGMASDRIAIELTPTTIAHFNDNSSWNEVKEFLENVSEKIENNKLS